MRTRLPLGFAECPLVARLWRQSNIVCYSGTAAFAHLALRTRCHCAIPLSIGVPSHEPFGHRTRSYRMAHFTSHVFPSSALRFQVQLNVFGAMSAKTMW